MHSQTQPKRCGWRARRLPSFSKSGRADGIAVVGAELGGWLCAAEQWPRAAQVLQPALAMAQRLDDKPRIEEISAALAQCAQHGVQLEQ